MKQLKFYLSLTLLSLHCAQTTKPDICDLTAGHMLRGTHYIDADLLTEEGLWDYRRWLEYYQKYVKPTYLSGCLPLKDKAPLPQQIDHLEKTIDLQR